MRLVLALATLVLTGCGYVGDPLPPALNIPVAPENLEAIQLGDRIVVQFRQSSLTTEGLTLPRLGPAQIEAGGETFETGDVAGGQVRFEISSARWTGQTIQVRARSSNGRGRFSAWTPSAELNVVAPLPTPSGLKAQSTSEGVSLRWDPAPEQAWVVTRTAKDGQTRLEASSNPFIDREAKLGAEYTYRVQAKNGTALSLPSDPISLTHIDRSPPEPATGLSAALNEGAVELTWERSSSEDTAAYRVYRRETSGEWRVIADSVTLPVYTDRTIESGKSYEYSVSAVDRSGNESERSNPAKVN